MLNLPNDAKSSLACAVNNWISARKLSADERSASGGPQSSGNIAAAAQSLSAALAHAFPLLGGVHQLPPADDTRQHQMMLAQQSSAGGGAFNQQQAMGITPLYNQQNQSVSSVNNQSSVMNQSMNQSVGSSGGGLLNQSLVDQVNLSRSSDSEDAVRSHALLNAGASLSRAADQLNSMFSQLGGGGTEVTCAGGGQQVPSHFWGRRKSECM